MKVDRMKAINVIVTFALKGTAGEAVESISSSAEEK